MWLADFVMTSLLMMMSQEVESEDRPGVIYHNLCGEYPFGEGGEWELLVLKDMRTNDHASLVGKTCRRRELENSRDLAVWIRTFPLAIA